MKAWQSYGTGKPLELNEAREPTAGPGEVVVDVKVGMKVGMGSWRPR